MSFDDRQDRLLGRKSRRVFPSGDTDQRLYLNVVLSTHVHSPSDKTLRKAKERFTGPSEKRIERAPRISFKP